MAELEEKAKQPCVEATENKADSHITLHIKEEKELSTKENDEHQKNIHDMQQVTDLTVEGNQDQGEGEHRECFKECLNKEKREDQDEDMVGKQMENNHKHEEQTLEPEATEIELAENGVKEGDGTIDLVEKNERQGEKNGNPEEKNMKEDGMLAESEKEKSHADEGNQDQGEGEHRESFKEPCLNKPKEPEEKNKKAGMITDLEKEKNQDGEEKTREPRQQSSKVEIKEEPVEKTSQDESEQAEKSEAVKRSSETNSKRSKKPTFKFFTREKRKYITIETGKTLNTHKKFLKRLHKKKSRLKEVDKAKEYKFIQVFCPVVSRAGTDIEVALHQLNKISDTKPAVLVVLHHTFDPECVVPDSSRAVTRENMIAVDCLFNEDKGLYKCSKNKIAVDKVAKWLKKKPWRNVK